MGEEQAITCHEGAPFAGVNGPTRWEERSYSGYRHCSYCGSLHPQDLRAILEAGGKLSGSDWKYGWPHKFYVHPIGGGMLKWYNAHLRDMSEEELAAFAPLLLEYSGIKFVREEGTLMCYASYYGYQRY